MVAPTPPPSLVVTADARVGLFSLVGGRL